ncbi:MAG TPA: hypothetical protein VFY79_12615 [Dehalococcoidia bacterium]|nr:hypothetical protein [Dehalococcoidia bacterium]
MISRRRGGASRIIGAGAVMVIGAVALMAAACGGSSSSNTPTSAPPTTAPATATVAAPPTASSTESSSTTGASTGGGTATVNIASSGTSRFVDDKGMSLYVFQKDTPNSGKSACSGGCSTAWPALTVPAGTQPTPGQGVDGLATITRDDGTMQVTYDGLPLYYYGGDSAPGDTMGMNIPNWALATP